MIVMNEILWRKLAQENVSFYPKILNKFSDQILSKTFYLNIWSRRPFIKGEI